MAENETLWAKVWQEDFYRNPDPGSRVEQNLIVNLPMAVAVEGRPVYIYEQLELAPRKALCGYNEKC